MVEQQKVIVLEWSEAQNLVQLFLGIHSDFKRGAHSYQSPNPQYSLKFVALLLI